MKTIEWTETHQREAESRCYELAANLRRTGAVDHAITLVVRASIMCRTRGGFEAILRDAWIGTDCVPRVVRRVDGLATGRLERTITWHVRGVGSHGASAPLERDAARSLVGSTSGSVVVRRTTIRKAR